MTSTNTVAIVSEPINDDYEWVQYNSKLRIIHSIKDDYFQMQSILTTCNAPDNKKAADWFENQSTKELLHEISLGREKATLKKPYENRQNLPIGLRGYYIHRLLVNAVAMWASPRYAWYIMILLDDLFAKEREEMQKVIETKDEEIKERIPRSVPIHKERNYKYMIYTEDVNDSELIKLNLVRRNNRTFSAVAKIKNSDKCWFFRENLPISMTPNEDVKDIVRKSFAGADYEIKGTTIIIYKNHLPLLHKKISLYFDTFRNEK